MHTHLFEAFLVLAEELNYRRAATRLDLSQPGLTKQIRSLEQELGVRLFLRDRTGTRLTPDGVALLPRVRSAVEILHRLTPAAPGALPSAARRLRVGVLGDGLGSLTWPVLSAFTQERPDVPIVLIRLGFAEAFRAIADGLADVVLSTGPFSPSEHQDVATVGEEPIAAVFTAGHPLASEPTADLERVAHDLTFDTPAEADPAFRQVWLLENLRARGGRRVSRLRPPPDGPVLADLVERVGHVGGVGLWPASIPVAPSSGCVVRPLDRKLSAPRQVLARRDDEHARTLLRLATEVPATARSAPPGG